MLMRTTEFLRLSATNGDDRFSLIDALFDGSNGKLTYVALDVGGWFNLTSVLIDAERLSDFDPDARTVTVTLSSKEVESAPHWDGDGSESPIDLTRMPPLIVGPFGSTYSPIMMAAQINDAETDEADPDLPRDVKQMERLSAWLQKDVFGSDGELGRLSDLLIDTNSLTIHHFVIEGGGLLSREERLVPYEALRHMAEGGSHIVLNTTAEKFAAAPADVAAERASDLKMAEEIRLHYGLGLPM